MMRGYGLLANATFLLLIGISADARAYRVGDQVECSGASGQIIRTEPRAGWDEPFYIVQVKVAATAYENKCLPGMMRPASGSPPADASSGAAAGRLAADSSSQPAASNDTALCQVGAKLEAQWGISWYAVTVQAAADANGKCAVSFDGYGREWDKLVGASQLRPPGGSGVYTRSPGARNVANERPAGAVATAPDGNYRCHTISPGGQLIDIGDLAIRNGQATLKGLPEGWTILSVSLREDTGDGKTRVALDYRSSAGFNDRLDCLVR